jgi:hypothetical protein
VDEDVDLRGLPGGFEGVEQRGSEERLSHPVVDTNQEEASGEGKRCPHLPSAIGAPEEGGGHQGECQLRP